MSAPISACNPKREDSPGFESACYLDRTRFARELAATRPPPHHLLGADVAEREHPTATVSARSKAFREQQ